MGVPMTVYTPATLPHPSRNRLREKPPVNPSRGDRGIYFISLAAFPLIKVGFTRDLYQRRASLQTNCPFRVVVEAFYTPADVQHEAWVHAVLGADCFSDEWFVYSRRLERVMMDFDGWFASGEITVAHGFGAKLERYKTPTFQGCTDLVDSHVDIDWLMRVF